MAKPRNSFEAMAADAAQRLDQVRASGEQLALMPDEVGRGAVEAGTGKPGRPRGAMGKGSSQLRRWLAERGMRMPEDQLAEIAGLASSEGAMLHAMAQAEQVMAWAYDGAEAAVGQAEAPGPAPEQRLALFMQLYAMHLRAAEALLPYGTPKAAPEGDKTPVVQINMPGTAAPDPGAAARDVSPGAAPGHRMVPADVRHEMQQDQGLSAADADHSDAETRTDGAND